MASHAIQGILIGKDEVPDEPWPKIRIWLN
jgi:hypothetical protein